MSASEALVAAATAALQGVPDLGIHGGPPLQAAVPHAIVEAGPETDWGHKSGAGRELRLAVTVRDRGERPERLRRLMGEAEAAVAAVSTLAGWQLVSLRFVRSRIAAPAKGGAEADWAGVIEYRARMLAA
ncbi:MAG TPA: DUF3168 domain-containing protein [Allosphingosinicella sp.]